MATISYKNFFNNTYGLFRGCKIPKKKYDFISYRKNYYTYSLYVDKFCMNKYNKKLYDLKCISEEIEDKCSTYGYLSFKEWKNSSLNQIQGNESSIYWYGSDSNGDYVIRYSDHWSNTCINIDGWYKRLCGKIATCCWELNDVKKPYQDIEGWRCGKIYLKCFKTI